MEKRPWLTLATALGFCAHYFFSSWAHAHAARRSCQAVCYFHVTKQPHPLSLLPESFLPIYRSRLGCHWHHSARRVFEPDVALDTLRDEFATHDHARRNLRQRQAEKR